MPSSTSFLAWVPLEILRLIIDELCDDRQSLLACRSVHRTWMFAADTHLFKKVVVREGQPIGPSQVLHILQGSPRLARHITKLECHNLVSTLSKHSVADWAQVIRHLQFLQALVFDGMYINIGTSPSHLESFYLALETLPLLHHLDLRLCAYDSPDLLHRCLSRVQSLRTLSLNDCNIAFGAPMYTVLPQLPFLLDRLEILASLHMRGRTTSLLSAIRTRGLVVKAPSWGDYDALAAVYRTSGVYLKKLSLDMGRSGVPNSFLQFESSSLRVLETLYIAGGVDMSDTANLLLNMLHNVSSPHLQSVTCLLRVSNNWLAPSMQTWGAIAGAILSRTWSPLTKDPRVQIMVPYVRRWGRVGAEFASIVILDAEERMADVMERGWVSIGPQDEEDNNKTP